MTAMPPVNDLSDVPWTAFQTAGRGGSHTNSYTLAVRIVATAGGVAVSVACPDIPRLAPEGSPARQIALTRVRDDRRGPLFPAGFLELASFAPGVRRPGVIVTVVVGTDEVGGVVQRRAMVERMDVDVTAALSFYEAQVALTEPSHPLQARLAVMNAVVTSLRNSGEFRGLRPEPSGASHLPVSDEDRLRGQLRALTVLANEILTRRATDRGLPVIFRNPRARAASGAEARYQVRDLGQDQSDLGTFAEFLDGTRHLVQLINLNQVLEPERPYSEGWLAVVAAHCSGVEYSDEHGIKLSTKEREVLALSDPVLALLPRISLGYLLLAMIDRVDASSELQAEVRARLAGAQSGGRSVLNRTACYAVLFRAPRPEWDSACVEMIRWIARDPLHAGGVLAAAAWHDGWNPDLRLEEVVIDDGHPPVVMVRATVDGLEHQSSGFHCGVPTEARAAAATDLLGVLAKSPAPRFPEMLPRLIAALESGTPEPEALEIGALRGALAYGVLGGPVPPRAAHALVRLATNHGPAVWEALHQLAAVQGMPSGLLPRVEMVVLAGVQPSVMAAVYQGDRLVHTSRLMRSPSRDPATAAALSDVLAWMVGSPPLPPSQLADLVEAIGPTAGTDAPKDITPAGARAYLALAAQGSRDPHQTAAVGAWLAGSPSRLLDLVMPPTGSVPGTAAPLATQIIRAGPTGDPVYVAIASVEFAGGPSPRAVALGQTDEAARRQAITTLAHDILGLAPPPPTASLRLLAAVGDDGVIPDDRLSQLRIADVRDVLLYAAHGGPVDPLQARAVLALLTRIPTRAATALDLAHNADGRGQVPWLQPLLAWSPEHPFASAQGSVQIGVATVRSDVHDAIRDDAARGAVALDLCAQILRREPPADAAGRLPDTCRVPSPQVPRDAPSLAKFDADLAASARAGVLPEALARDALLRMAARRISRVSLYNLIFGADATHPSWTAVRAQALALLSFRPELAFKTAEIAGGRGLMSALSIAVGSARGPRGELAPALYTARFRAVVSGTQLEIESLPRASKEQAVWDAAVRLIRTTRAMQAPPGLGVLDPSEAPAFERTLDGKAAIPLTDTGPSVE